MMSQLALGSPFCPECGQTLDLGGQPEEGQRLTCPQCGARLEVINLRPLELDWVYAAPGEVWEVEHLNLSDSEDM